MSYLIISTSLRAESNSRKLAHSAAKNIKGAEVVDLRDYPLPSCDGELAYNDKNVKILSDKIQNADGILVAVPIYNYSTGSAFKNLVELTGDAWNGKVVGFLCAAGGKSSYMSVMGIANSLMLDFRCVIVPRFVYATYDHFDGEDINAEITQRITELGVEFTRMSTALKM